MGNVVFHNKIGVLIFSSSMRVLVSILLGLWPLGSVVCGAHGSSGLQPSDGSAEEPGSEAVEQPWVLCG